MRSTCPLHASLLLAAALGAGCAPSADGAQASSGTASAVLGNPNPTSGVASMTIHELEVRRLDGTPEKLSSYTGKVLLVVNVASECGYTPQYEGLQALHTELSGKGFSVLGFPSNDFGAQEPGTSEQIGAFCKKNYGVEFPMFEKIVTKGAEASPLYKLLGASAGEPKWNFHKYLVGKDGKVIQGFPSSVAPESAELRKAIDAALSQG